MCTIQSVLNRLKNINPLTKNYVLNLMLAHGRKNCAAMADAIGSSVKPLYSFLSDAKTNTPEIEKYLLQLASETKKDGVLRALVIDPTSIIKPYSQKIEKTCYDRAGCSKRVERCLVPVYAALTDQNITIPFGLNFWMQKKIVGAKKYKSKVEITQELILATIDKKNFFDFVSLDGAFAVRDMFNFFEEHNALKFIMRIPRNRLVKIGNEAPLPLKMQPLLKLKRNERARTVQGELYGKTYFFTAEKRKNRNDEWETVFLVSNMDLSAKEQVAAYALRWPIEIMIRTTKQKFGATQCQTLKASKQRAHIMAGFLSYAIIDSLKNDKQDLCVDVAVKKFRKFYYHDLISEIEMFQQVQSRQNTDLLIKNFQNRFKFLLNNYDAMRFSYA